MSKQRRRARRQKRSEGEQNAAYFQTAYMTVTLLSFVSFFVTLVRVQMKFEGLLPSDHGLLAVYVLVVFSLSMILVWLWQLRFR